MKQAAQAVDGRTARAFVSAARHFIDALLIEGQRVASTATPPAGGWLSSEELRGATQRMSEAIAAERWVDGALAVVRVLVLLGI
ncbi:MAG: hypothetical protein HZB38_01905 [Planctomycetes bacterium]|nr:hypothetical protein [Planctomycetota bacterium]